MIDPKVFYRKFQVNFWDYKALTLERLLKDSEGKRSYFSKLLTFLKLGLFMQSDLRHLSSILGYSKNDYRLTLRVEIRQNLLHAIEVLFTLIFSLKPKMRLVDDQNLWYSFSKRRLIYQEVESIAERKEGSLDFMDLPLDLSDGSECPFGRYIFYLANNKKSHRNNKLLTYFYVQGILERKSLKLHWNAVSETLRFIQNP